ncbi:uncharacterized protein LOC105420469 isoform X2 [Amborella trichopoda]|uniref:uncharacterized protein LOC105420469 isoform X2 n=1 Tax=Amborella trichopoda TaxID=13333 RepID=UPI0009C0F5A9|nr:uncharacterized protein LOC105420469 isoform X2 [Amborella trichopoda]|eukprot:XP_020521436.1 uncharacterized protein LOC105420469 isoform X2 [Amborella trichopoda]
MGFALSSQGGVVLAAAMAFSGTMILLNSHRKKLFDESLANLRPCISSQDKRREGEKKKQKKKKMMMRKRVHFAEDVMEPKGDSKEFRRKHTMAPALRIHENKREINKKSAINEVSNMPANWRALYSGILRDRSQRMAWLETKVKMILNSDSYIIATIKQFGH